MSDAYGESMTTAQSNETAPNKPLRLWPGVVAVVLQWLAFYVAPMVMSGPSVGFIAMIGGLVGGLLVIVWWAFFSRAHRFERWGALVLMTVALTATSFVLHESIGSGMMRMVFFFYAIPVLSLAFVAWALVGRHLADGPRRAAMVVTILLACGGWTLLRTEGLNGSGSAEFAWRWSETSEQQLLARTADEPPLLPPTPAPTETTEHPIQTEVADAPTEVPAIAEPTGTPPAPEPAPTRADWPGFRGPNRDSLIRGIRIEPDWSQSPPVELWRRPIGPGWSSFAVDGDLLYTQEQRGEDEIVACYNITTGEPVWSHRDAVRFWESIGGAGPRATPTLSDGRLYTFGATGILNALNAADGTVLWSRNAGSDAGAKVPIWGFSSSPLVTDDLVIVAVPGQLVASDLATGDLRWLGPAGGDGYSSPHLATIHGVSQVLLMSGTGAAGVAPANGRLLWEHPWPTSARIVQPALTADGDVLMSAGESSGVRRVAISHGPDRWTAEERWTSFRLKPYFNDFVIHKGHAYGFDGRILASIDLNAGERKWKGGRYGHGQLVLLPDQDLLLVLSEEGELALVKATPGKFTELAKFPAITGKTWNHPVLAGDILLVRNGQEMAAFRLPLEHN